MPDGAGEESEEVHRQDEIFAMWVARVDLVLALRLAPFCGSCVKRLRITRCVLLYMACSTNICHDSRRLEEELSSTIGLFWNLDTPLQCACLTMWCCRLIRGQKAGHLGALLNF
uniref:Uncharacterized protein n=1 Tax=Oryza rufipogon TaxID=4529 RepID=A0A0E0PDA2_ORYRU